MNAQLSLPDIPPALPKHDRLFLGLLPPPAAIPAATRNQRNLIATHDLAVEGRPILPERFHVTLPHVDDFAGLRPDIVRAVCEAAASVVTHPFQVVFDRAMSFVNPSGNYPLVLLCSEGRESLEQFHQTLCSALSKVGIKPRNKLNFTPHLTLLYARDILAEQPVEPVAWTVTEFRLIHSLLLQTRYIELGRWSLR